MELNRNMPDVAKDSRATVARHSIALDWVGMSKIEMPVLLASKNGVEIRVPALVDAMVSLDKKDSRGIHMSRLYVELQNALANSTLGQGSIASTLEAFLLTHQDLSRRAKLEIRFEALLQRKALKTDFLGWRTYPVRIFAEKNQDQAPEIWMEVEVVYSSTCPASAALARQLIQDNFRRDFPSETVGREATLEWLGRDSGHIATPHAQRSYARVRVLITSGLDFETLIDRIESALGTPVQTAVKREDEQEFARLNGENLMFCEDACRKIYQSLDAVKLYEDFEIEVRHVESLHPHDAVSLVRKKSSPT